MPHTARPLPPPTSEPERRLIRAARRGDATAQARTLTQYEPMMQHVARRLSLPGAEHEDLAQETRLGLLDATRTWDPDRGVPFSNFAWLCATREARNALRAARRYKHRVITTAAPLDVADTTTLAAGDTPYGHEAVAHPRQRPRPITRTCADSRDLDPVAKTLAREQLRDIIARARTLTPLERRALALASTDHPHREIAETLHIRVRAVNNALQRARHKLREPVAA